MDPVKHCLPLEIPDARFEVFMAITHILPCHNLEDHASTSVLWVSIVELIFYSLKLSVLVF
jgi:hypothetical protein